MSLTAGALNAWESYMICQGRDMEKTKERKYPLKPFVTISRQAGAGGITIGEKLVKFLGEEDKETACPWTLFDQNLVTKVMEEHRFPENYTQFMPEDRISEIQDMIEELFGLHPSSWALARKTSETILHLARMGNVILVGRGTSVITRKFLPGGLHVRFVGSLEKRIQHIQDYYRISHAQAAEFIKKQDLGRKHYLKYHFDKDIEDPLLYDLIINTDNISYGDAAKIIGRTLLNLKK